jgi:ABC-type lipoprotein export system ATPase subunit
MKSEAPRITRITITSLFGIYDYDLPGTDAESFGQSIILYGDNGSGKTTILHLVFHMLSAANNRHHRTSIAQIPFRSVRIELSNGVALTASRDKGDLRGDYMLSGHFPDMDVECAYVQDKTPAELGDAYRHYIEQLSRLDLVVYLLTDDREILSDTISRPRHDPDRFGHYEAEVPRRTRLHREPTGLRLALQAANQWISRQVTRGASTGDYNVNTIYAEIVRGLVKQEPHTDEIETATGISATLRELSKRSEAFAVYKLISPIPADALIEQINQASRGALHAIAQVLKPYVDGTKARLDALEDVRRIISIFVTNFAEFFKTKRVTFDVVDGLQFSTERGQELAPEQLSSGERQLLRLFCYTLVSRDSDSIFIIDEPELSLNIKWQRALIQAINAIVEGSGNQFLFATHSMEILAQHRRSVVSLRPRTSNEGIPIEQEVQVDEGDV